jgi:copper homeostasis protein CutC
MIHIISKLFSSPQVTFHRAFDMCADPAAALETLIRVGVARLLTSGLSATALQGKGSTESKCFDSCRLLSISLHHESWCFHI